MSLSYGNRRALLRRASAASLMVQPADSSLVIASDSKFSQVSVGGMKNTPLNLVDRLAGRLRLSVGGDQGIGGNTIDDLQARIGFTTAQKGDFTLVAIGHNSLSLGSAAVIAKLTTLQTSLRAGLGAGKPIIWTTVLASSAFPVDNATLVAVNDFIMGFHNTDGGYTKACNLTYRSTDNGGSVFVPTTMCYMEAGPIYIHPNEVGSAFVSGLLASFFDPLVSTQTVAGCLNDILATSVHTANVDPVYLMPTAGGAAAGTKTGTTTPTGTVADRCDVANNTTAAVACSVATVNGEVCQIVDITGAVSVEGTVVFSRQNATGGRIPINAVPGDIVEALVGYQISHTDGASAPVGAKIWGLNTDTTVAGYSLGVAAASDANLSGGASTLIGPRVARTYPHPQQTSLTNSRPSFTLRLAAGAVNIRLLLWKPILRKTELNPYAVPTYVGLDGIKGASERLGYQAGTVANANVITFRPGAFTGGGAPANFYTGARVYLGGSAAVGSGAKLADVAANTWTWMGSGMTSGTGQVIYFELDANNGNGGTVTTRSAAIAVP
ncbi:MAG: fibronectin type protein [Caulobacter sp.]|nr:fibronectin type protein [Caulobacter sp.]